MIDCYWCGGTGTVLPEQGVTHGGQTCTECRAGELKKQKDRLAAAAPDLLEALRIFVSCAYPVSTEINERGHNWVERYLDEALVTARAAIAKAKGIEDAPA